MSRWAIFISGRGSNLQALSELQADIDIGLCVTSHLKVSGVLRARRNGIPVLKIDTKVGLGEWQRVHQELTQRKINRIFLLGFMRLIPAEFIQEWEGRIFNLHPSLLPKYPGKEALERSFSEGAAMGATIHHVTAEMDAGEIVRQEKFCNSSNAGHVFSLEEARWGIARIEQKIVRMQALWN